MSDHPKVAVPAARSRLSSLKMRRRLVLGALIFAAICGLFAAYKVLTFSPPVQKTIVSPASSSVALATQVATDYLNGKNTQIPTADGVNADLGYAKDNKVGFKVVVGPTVSSVTPVSWDGATNVINLVKFYVGIAQNETVEVNGKPTQQTNTHYYTLTVPMTAPTAEQRADGREPVLAGTPTLEPFVGAAPGSLPGADLKNAANNKAVTELSPGYAAQIKDWATAFAAAGYGKNDPNVRALQQLTGDTRAEYLYTGLGGWKVVSATPVSAAPAPTKPDVPPDQQPYPWGKGYIVQVQLVLTPPSANGPTVHSNYDVWVAPQSDTDATPKVVAWAPAGTYSDMQPYMNARPTG